MYTLLGIFGVMTFLSLVVVGGATAYGVQTYNRIVRRENQIDEAHGSIQTNLKKRHDLIPNLVSTVQEYADHESETLERVVELRNRAQSGNLTEQERQQVETQLSGALDRLMVQVEDYPDLNASDNFEQLQRSLNEVEEQLSASRRFYNAAVTQYNDSIETFPANVIAKTFNFEERAVFETEEHERETPNVGALFDE
jgi:LemA protein